MKLNLTTNKKPISSKSRYLINRYGPIYAMLIPAFILVFVFMYVPMPGILMAFMDYDFILGFDSPWVGLANIKNILFVPEFSKAITNTLMISCLNLLISFPAPIIFALLLNEIVNVPWKRFVQTVSYLPYFLSWMAVVGLASTIFGFYGPINDVRTMIFGEEVERIMYLAKQNVFIGNILGLSLWKGLGWNSIIYIATITGINPDLYEAAQIDGAGKFRQCIHVTIPGLRHTIVMLFIISIGGIFNDNFELIYGLDNVFIDFDVISTLVYKRGITQGDYSTSTALGFVQGGMGFILMMIANQISKKVNNVAIW